MSSKYFCFSSRWYSKCFQEKTDFKWHFPTYSWTGNIPSYKYYCLKSWRIGRIYCWTWADVYLTNTFHNWKSTVRLKLSPRTTTTNHLPISQISEQTLKSLEFIVTALQTVKKYNLRAGLELNKWVEWNCLLKSSLVQLFSALIKRKSNKLEPCQLNFKIFLETY